VIVVQTKDGDEEFPGRVGYCTDEHNNLEIITGPEESIAVFAEGFWQKAVIDGES
jgi:hypothetical protein